MTKYGKIVLVATIAAALVVATGGVAMAASSLDDSASLSNSNTFEGIKNWFKKGITIGQQGSGGVTYYNGTIANSTTDEDGNDNPVTIGDDTRIDGAIYRTEVGGTYPVKFADSLMASKSNTYSLGTNAMPWKNLYLGDDAYQARSSFGVPKAAAVVASDGELSRSTENVTNGDYTISSSRTTTGVFTVDFNFDVSDRYIAITPHGTDTAPTTASYSVSSDTVTVYIADVLGGPALADAAFDIVVF